MSQTVLSATLPTIAPSGIGTGVAVTTTATTMNAISTVDKSRIDFTNFNLTDATFNAVQPHYNSIMLLVDHQSGPSMITGAANLNSYVGTSSSSISNANIGGQLWLINPNGIMLQGNGVTNPAVRASNVVFSTSGFKNPTDFFSETGSYTLDMPATWTGNTSVLPGAGAVVKIDNASFIFKNGGAVGVDPLFTSGLVAIGAGGVSVTNTNFNAFGINYSPTATKSGVNIELIKSNSVLLVDPDGSTANPVGAFSASAAFTPSFSDASGYILPGSNAVSGVSFNGTPFDIVEQNNSMSFNAVAPTFAYDIATATGAAAGTTSVDPSHNGTINNKKVTNYPGI